MKTYYLTTAIVYPNAKPHIGFAYEQIVADSVARWHALKGEDVFFLTGTDENALKVEESAKSAGKPVKLFVDEIVSLYLDLAKKLNISFSRFIRTTEPAHFKVAQNIFKKVQEKGLIYKGFYEGLYCQGCEAFFTEKDLVDGKCSFHKKEVIKLKEESYFFKLSFFQKEIVDLVGSPRFILPPHRKNEILARLKEPLRDLSISRRHSGWGIPVPGDEEHVIYVWFDALLNYFSGVDFPGKNFKKFWPAQCHVIGKEISWFHTVIWPAILMAAEIPLPETILVHGWLTVNGQKMSKSLGNVVDPFELIEHYGSDPVRFYFLREIACGEDGDYNLNSFVERNNADLSNALGNLLQRTVVLSRKYFESGFPVLSKLADKEKALIGSVPVFADLDRLMQDFQIHKCIERIWEFIDLCNKYINDCEPWKVKDEDRLGTILYTLLECLRIVSVLVWPFIPESAERISEQIGIKITGFSDVKFRNDSKGWIKEPVILFKKFEVKEVESLFSILDLKVAKVVDVKDHPSAENLYIIDIDCGEKRQLVAGLKQYLKPSELKGKNVVFVSNLKPAKLRGVVSQGMILAAEKDEKVRVLEAKGSVAGDQVFIEGVVPKTKQIDIGKFKDIVLSVKDKKVFFGKSVLKTFKEDVFVDIADDSVIR